MPTVYSTIAGASHACRHVKNLKKATLLTAEQQKEKAAARAEKQARGAHMINHQDAINPYNTFKSFKAAEVRKAGESKSGVKLHQDYFDEYNAMTDAKKTSMVNEFEKVWECNFHLHRDTPHAKVQDVANVVCNIKMLMFSLGQCVGVKGFFCIVRNNILFKMEPEWYFTSKELKNYMEIATRK
ncbi:hypothetical protein B0H14DRAFT_2564009 [Mycena olivaceomarginata]|nr:hypothetical protein B0H14DRAFT_2564009 [Mycena olivaceomarginata]